MPEQIDFGLVPPRCEIPPMEKQRESVRDYANCANYRSDFVPSVPGATRTVADGSLIFEVELNPEWVEISEKLQYWCARMTGLERPEYFTRMAFDWNKCFHGATGPDQRFARWRLAYNETIRLAILAGNTPIFK